MRNMNDVFKYLFECIMSPVKKIQSIVLYLDGHLTRYCKRLDALILAFFTEKVAVFLEKNVIDFVENIFVGAEIVFMGFKIGLETFFDAKVSKLAKVLGSFRIALETFTVRWSLRWYLFFAQYVTLAVICIAVGFGIGTVLIILFYDDGLERVMDVYNYFKNPPRR